jgi:plasmid maintenance system antidote protein VapI
MKPTNLSANAPATALCVPATRIGALIKDKRAVTAGHGAPPWSLC